MLATTPTWLISSFRKVRNRTVWAPHFGTGDGLRVLYYQQQLLCEQPVLRNSIVVETIKVPHAEFQILIGAAGWRNRPPPTCSSTVGFRRIE